MPDRDVPAPATEGQPPARIRRRTVLQGAGIAAAAGAAGAVVLLDGDDDPASASPVDSVEPGATTQVTLAVNGTDYPLELEPRVTLLDALREQIGLTGTKKGCDRGECGACTLLVDGERVNSCLTLAIMQQGREITTVEGLASGDTLHPVQDAFIRHDAFQCGGCTPGQVMSAVACIAEGHTRSRHEIREWMSGNLCRCAAYQNIVAAVADAAGEAVA